MNETSNGMRPLNGYILWVGKVKRERDEGNLRYLEADHLPSGRDPHSIFTKTTPRVNQTLCLSHKGLRVSGVRESRYIPWLLINVKM
jgi:hypothetical protein